MAGDDLVSWLRAEIEADKRAAAVKVIRTPWLIDTDQGWAAGTGIIDEMGRSIAVAIGDYAARHNRSARAAGRDRGLRGEARGP